jgi:hypothetical protein
MEWDVTDRMEVVRVAWPLPSKVAVPRLVAPSKNSTVPVGVPVLELTVAVNVTDCPKTEGFADEARLVLLVAC